MSAYGCVHVWACVHACVMVLIVVDSDDPDESVNKDESINKEAGKELSYGFVYLNHPNTVTGFMWRKLSPLMPV